MSWQWQQSAASDQEMFYTVYKITYAEELAAAWELMRDIGPKGS